MANSIASQDSVKIINEYVGKAKWAAAKKEAQALNGQHRELDQAYSQLWWRWGDLSLKLAPPSLSQHARSVLMELFIKEMEFPGTKKSLWTIRHTCKAWPPAQRRNASFRVHQSLACHANRFDLIRDGMTHGEAQVALGHRPVPLYRKSASSIECARAVKGWTTTLASRMPGKPSEELVVAVTDAWLALTEIMDDLAVLDELLVEYHENHSAASIAA